jgi:erythromycin esterase-like protein
MTPSTDVAFIQGLRETVRPLAGGDPHTALMEAIGDARVVMLGEASHGTHEFYDERIRITQRLIIEKGFNAVAVEADWPDAYRVNRFVRGSTEDKDADTALSGFKRFPTWMWRNTDVLDFVRWLKVHDDSLPAGAPKVGFYGLDLYSLRASIDEVLKYLETIDSQAARLARERYRCFDDFGGNVEDYARSAALGVIRSCEDAVVRQLVDLLEKKGRTAAGSGSDLVEEEWFQAVQNARVVKNAEQYYRTMYRGNIESWNLRDRHMAETAEELLHHLDRRVGRSKLVIWEHNSHLGDARATELGQRGELNVGQLMRERHGNDAYALGFTTHEGTVTAASDWGGPAERKRVRRALPGSYESLFHRLGIPRFELDLRNLGEAAGGLREPRLERAIGVLYLPSTERGSHYFAATLPSQFDAVIHLDVTTAVEPLERMALWEAGEPAETYPTGI